MRNSLLIPAGKLLSKAIQVANLGNGSTWPGHLALKANKYFISDVLKKSQTKIVFIVGTNGKTTTTSLLYHLLKKSGKRVIQNTSGANLLNGIASTLLLNTDVLGKLHAEYALFEIDENAFPIASHEITPDIIIMLNLFRDQLDRYGEVNTIAKNWQNEIKKLPGSTVLILNADDPQIAFLGHEVQQKVLYFGLDEKGSSTRDHASDSTYCPICGTKLIYTKTYYSHLGVWSCPTGDFKHQQDVFTTLPLYPLDGQYNHYNINAAYLCGLQLGLSPALLQQHLRTFKPAFGRQEKIQINGRQAEVILAKNPAGFNQTVQTVLELKAKNILLILNDNIADGTDVSWIWDVDFEKLKNQGMIITVSGTRVYDLALRLKYAGLESQIEPHIVNAIEAALSATKENETLFILPTYTAMLDVRRQLVGKKIL